MRSLLPVIIEHDPRSSFDKHLAREREEALARDVKAAALSTLAEALGVDPDDIDDEDIGIAGWNVNHGAESVVFLCVGDCRITLVSGVR